MSVSITLPGEGGLAGALAKAKVAARLDVAGMGEAIITDLAAGAKRPALAALARPWARRPAPQGFWCSFREAVRGTLPLDRLAPLVLRSGARLRPRAQCWLDEPMGLDPAGHMHVRLAWLVGVALPAALHEGHGGVAIDAVSYLIARARRSTEAQEAEGLGFAVGASSPFEEGQNKSWFFAAMACYGIARLITR